MANALASAPVESEGARALLQKRVALFARVVNVMGLLIQLFSRWITLGSRQTPVGAAMSWIPNAHLVVIAVTLVVLWRASSGVRTTLELRVLDALCVLVPLTFSAIALWHSDPSFRPNFVLVMSTAYLLTLRAVLIPSSGRRTAMIGLAFVFGIAIWTDLYYSVPGRREVMLPQHFAVATAVWALIDLQKLVERGQGARGRGGARARADVWSALGGAFGRPHPPRHQAGQRAPVRAGRHRRSDEGRGLRSRQGPHAGRLARGIHDGSARRHAALHVTRVPREAGAEVSEALESLLLACLSKRPEGRPTTAGELGKRLSDLPARHELGPDALSEWWQRTRRLEASPTPDREPSVASASTVLNIELDARA